MKNKILLTAITMTLIMTGCADKNLHTTSPNLNGNVSGGNGTGTGSGTETYQNVDPYGSGNGQYGNGEYGNGQYGSGGYSDNGGSYANAGVQNIYFNVDQYSISADKLGQISQNATLLRQNLQGGSKVKIEGHCDASGTDEYNYALGLRRAKAAKDALMTNGISASSISLVSMGESSPECTDSSSSSCYAKNRRVEFKVVQ